MESQHSYGGALPSVTTVPGDQMPSSGLFWTSGTHVVHRHTPRQNKIKYILKLVGQRGSVFSDITPNGLAVLCLFLLQVLLLVVVQACRERCAPLLCPFLSIWKALQKFGQLLQLGLCHLFSMQGWLAMSSFTWHSRTSPSGEASTLKPT